MFDKMISQSQQFWSGWGEIWQEQLQGLQSVNEEALRFQRQQAERATAVLDEATTLSRTSMEQAMALGEQWRAASLDAWRRGAEMMTSKAAAAES